MTTITKLSIQGVRSYSDSAPESIEFFRPLTIIVGNNGCGKTTIIEALKYVTTGTLPPLSDGGKSFIHDPALESQSLTRAQIRLTFRTNGDEQAVLAVRSFQLTQTNRTRSFKALESVLKVKQLTGAGMGTERSVSNKCADMDKLVPQMMGVAAAVLENVIFCHQSESDWPLSDSKALKMKFDDIFAATRYTKALEVLAKVRKDKAQSVKVMEAELQGVETAREQARKLREELEGTKRSIEGSIEKRGKIDAEVLRLEEEMKKYQGEVDKVRELEQAIKESKLRIQMMEGEKVKAYDHMQSDISDSDEVIMRSKATEEQRKTRLAADIAEQERKTKSLSASVEVNDREYQESVRLIGKHEQQQREREQRQADIAALRHRMVQQYHVDESKMDEEDDCMEVDGSDDAGGVDQRFARVMARVLERKREDLRQHKATVQKVDGGFEESIAKFRAKEVKTSEAFSHKRLMAGKAVARIKELVGRNKEVEAVMAVDEFQQVQAELGELEQRMGGADGGGQQDGEEETVRMSMSEKQRLLNSLQADVLVLTEERKKYAHQSELITLIKHRHSQLSSLLVKHNQALGALIAANDADDIKLPTVQPMPASTSSFTALYGKEYDSAQLQPLLQEAYDRVKSELRAKERELSTQVNDQSRLAGQQKMLTEESATLNSAVDRIRSQFSALGEEEHLSLSFFKEQAQWDEEVLALQQKLVKLTADGQKALVLVELYQKYLAKTAEDHKCQLCQKPFSATEEEQFKERVEHLVKQVSSEESRERNEKKIAACKKRLKVMHDLTPLVHDFLRLHTTERQQLAARVEAVKRDEDEYERRSEEMRRQVKTLSKREQRLAELLPLAANLARLYGDVMDTIKGIEKERTAMQASGSASGGRGLEGITRELEDKEKQRSRIQGELTALQEKVQQAMRAREERTMRFHTLKGKASEMNRLVEEKDKNLLEVGKLKAEWEEAKEEADKLSVQHSAMKEEIVQQEKAREEQRKRNAEGESTLMAAVSTLQRDVDTYQQLLDTLAHITAELNNAQAAGSTKQQLLDRASQLKTLRDQRDNALHTLTALKEQLQSCISDLADLDANIEYRKRHADIEQQQSTLTQLQQQHSTLTSDSSFLAQLSQSEQRLALLRSRRSELKGVMSQLEKVASDRLADLASPMYKDVQQRWSSKLIELKTSEMAVTDLETYVRALDVALMHYHTVKMREINDLLRDYWKAIYRGHDIDDIFIKSQVETESGKRRTYSYSVMMRQGDIELEMRGRCSAGQRVLACLLIRLALADCFCLTAGMLALDEPTTNLDEGNIGAFAQSLVELIDKRRRQSNFQLIIITHDERFVEEVGRRAQAEYYYRVSKDAHNYSRIRRVAWQDDKEE